MTACSSSDGPQAQQPPAPEHPSVTIKSLQPALLVPGTTVVLSGGSFIDGEMASARLRLRGHFGDEPVDLSLPASVADVDAMHVSWPGASKASLGGDQGTFKGTARLEIDDALVGGSFNSNELPVELEVRPALSPRLQSLQQGVVFINDLISIEGDGFLLGGAEGQTVAVIEGCYRTEGSSNCDPVKISTLPVQVVQPFDRTKVAFAFSPRIAGIQPGSFEGTVKLRNEHGKAAGSVQHETEAAAGAYEIVPPAVFSLSPASASLGQYVDVHGGGFLGTISDDDPTEALTTLQLEGTFQAEGSSQAMQVAVDLVPEFVSGRLVRYVLNEQDELGRSINLRKTAGTFSGTVRPITRFGTAVVSGDAADTQFAIGSVKQVVWVNFLPAYVQSLRHFGLRALDQPIRERVMAVASRDYEGINIEFRLTKPQDFALFAQVDLGGPDPNGYGLLGYDNTPGKDVGNTRLYDKIGGVNAATQEDGYPGYGGVFVESFFGFSMHPGSFSQSIEGADPLFDQIFDPFRPDVGGSPVRAQELAAGIPSLSSGDQCPSTDRATQIACAIWVMGSMIGTTMTHEVAHSLGLADPNGLEFHNPGDVPNRLMDNGRDRTFAERAELLGQGPAVFCDEDFAYLQSILPTNEPDPLRSRPSCW